MQRFVWDQTMLNICYLLAFSGSTGSWCFALLDVSCDHSITHGEEKTYHLPCLEELVAKKQVGSDARARGNAISQHPVRIVDAFLDRVHGLPCEQIETYNIAVGLLFLQCRH